MQFLISEMEMIKDELVKRVDNKYQQDQLQEEKVSPPSSKDKEKDEIYKNIDQNKGEVKLEEKTNN